VLHTLQSVASASNLLANPVTLTGARLVANSILIDSESILVANSRPLFLGNLCFFLFSENSGRLIDFDFFVG
jgi:hypothetical protein